MLARFRAAGFGPAEAEVYAPEGHPKEGGLIARLPGTDPSSPALLLVDHIDVVAADAKDWGRDPFRLVEQDGFFVGRGVIDDKALAAIWVDSLVRMKREGFRPRRTIKVALTCGEESANGVNGVAWLLAHRRDAVEAGFALNEGGHGILDKDGHPLALYLAVGEKNAQTFTLTVTNPGGHSSRPRPDNAVYALAGALLRIRNAPFPVTLSPTTTAWAKRMALIIGGEMGRALARLAADPSDAAAQALVTRDVTYNAMLRTTCTPTILAAGHAVNALPQAATAKLQCCLLPGDSVASVHAALVGAVADPTLTLTRDDPGQDVVAVAPPLDPAVLGPAEAVARELFRDLPVVPMLLTAGTDGKYLSSAGIPTYGVPGILLDPDGNGAHGVNERVRTRSIWQGRDYLYALLKRYAAQ